jgi:hypothetical protein
VLGSSDVLVHSEDFDTEGRVWVVRWLACQVRGKLLHIGLVRLMVAEAWNDPKAKHIML